MSPPSSVAQSVDFEPKAHPWSGLMKEMSLHRSSLLKGVAVDSRQLAP
ncbi:hypothetical protein [Corallococcus sp. M7]